MKRFDELHIDGQLVITPKSQDDFEFCMGDNCYTYKQFSDNLVKRAVPYNLYENDKQNDIQSLDNEIINKTPKSLCFNDSCINGEHLKLLKGTNGSNIFYNNRKD